MLQTFVQSVNPGSPSFMAGLYPGDAIVEVNGVSVKYAPVESVVEEIQKGAKTGERYVHACIYTVCMCERLQPRGCISPIISVYLPESGTHTYVHSIMHIHSITKSLLDSIEGYCQLGLYAQFLNQSG